MEHGTKGTYSAPKARAIEFLTQDILCQSLTPGSADVTPWGTGSDSSGDI